MNFYPEKVFILFLLLTCSRFSHSQDCIDEDSDCYNDASCQDGVCICPIGWDGNKCQHCKGRFLVDKESGTIQDGPYQWGHFSDCLWLIQLDPTLHQPNTTLLLSFGDVKIVCQGDFLTVYDGSGIFSPVLATFNGNSYPSRPVQRDVIAASGKALLYFHSQTEIRDDGYSVGYQYISEPDPLEPGEKPWMYYYSLNWSNYAWSGMTSQGRASAATALIKEDFYIFGGFMFGEDKYQEQMMRINAATLEANIVPSTSSPSPRFGHTMVSWKDQLIVFGGMLIDTFTITNEVWSFNVMTMEWTHLLPHVVDTTVPPKDKITTLPPLVAETTVPKEDKTTVLRLVANDTTKNPQVDTTVPTLPPGPDTTTLTPPVDETTDAPTLFGHTSHLLNLNDGRNVMLVIFGFHPRWQFSNFVFEYDIDKNTWSRVKCSGAAPHGSYGHASAHDEVNNLVYVHGGVKGRSSYEDEMFVYDAENKFWSTLKSIPSPRYLHSMVLLDNSLLVYNGRSLVGYSGETCPDVPFEKYDIASDTWVELPLNFSPGSSRYGHSALAMGDRTMFVYGGYDGTMYSDVITYAMDLPTLCSNDSDCSLSPYCVLINGTCSNLQCLPEIENYMLCDDFCAYHTTCVECLSTALQCCNCSYCPSCPQKCFYGNDNSSFTNISLCDADESMEEFCDSFLNCEQCNVADGCTWTNTRCQPGNSTSLECPPSCSEQTNCSTCLSVVGCRWCESTSTCLSQSVTDVYYPYGTCMNWRNNDCKDPCLDYTSCDLCSEDVRCGWCATDVNTGTGTCLSGSSDAPVNNMTCMNGDWFFITCPDCQCNGHSQCEEGSDICSNCSHHTTGETCDTCVMGYYGQPVNGANCTECNCNGHSDDCSDEGSCYCRVNGMTGTNCESCQQNSDVVYDGDPTAENGTCFYYILVQYLYRFTMTGTRPYVTEMNFENCALLQSDLLFKVESQYYSGDVQMFDIDIKYNYTGNDSVPEKLYQSYSNLTSLQLLLKQSEFHFGGNPRCCLRIYLRYQTPFKFEFLSDSACSCCDFMESPRCLVQNSSKKAS